MQCCPLIPSPKSYFEFGVFLHCLNYTTFTRIIFSAASLMGTISPHGWNVNRSESPRDGRYPVPNQRLAACHTPMLPQSLHRTDGFLPRLSWRPSVGLQTLPSDQPDH